MWNLYLGESNGWFCVFLFFFFKPNFKIPVMQWFLSLFFVSAWKENLQTDDNYTSSNTDWLYHPLSTKKLSIPFFPHLRSRDKPVCWGLGLHSPGVVLSRCLSLPWSFVWVVTKTLYFAYLLHLKCTFKGWPIHDSLMGICRIKIYELALAYFSICFFISVFHSTISKGCGS